MLSGSCPLHTGAAEIFTGEELTRLPLCLSDPGAAEITDLATRRQGPDFTGLRGIRRKNCCFFR